MTESKLVDGSAKKRFSWFRMSQVIAAHAGAATTVVILMIYQETGPHQFFDYSSLWLLIINYPASWLADILHLRIPFWIDDIKEVSGGHFSLLWICFAAIVNGLILLLLTTLVGLLIKFIKKANEPM